MKARNAVRAGRKPDGHEIVGRNYPSKRFARSGWRRPGVAVLVGLVLGGILLVSLRMAIVRTRYALADAVATETTLMDQERRTAVALRGLRDPRRLIQLAEAQGFGRPERVVELAAEPVAP